MVLNNIFFSLFPCLRKYRKIPKNLVFKDLNNFYPNIRKGRVIKVYDGDSITIAARIPELKNNTIYKFSIRLNRLDTPELRTNNHIEKEYAIKIRDLLSERIMNKMVNIKVIKTDKYGRYLAEISYKKLNINDWLINNGYAVNYSGGIIITDWYNEGGGESVKITIRFLSNEVRVDALSIKVFTKQCGANIDCQISENEGSLPTELKKNILKKAAIYEKQNKDKNFKEYQVTTPGDNKKE